MTNSDIECKNAIFGLNWNVRIGFRISLCDNRPQFESKKKKIFKCQNEIFGPNMNVKIGFRNSKFDNRPYLNVKIGFRMSKCDSVPVRMSK